MTNFFSWLPARWLVALLPLLAAAGPALAQTTVTLPTVTTVAPATGTIAEDQASLGGNVTSDGGAPVGTLSAGVVYSPNGSVPTLNASGSTSVYISSGVGSYSRLVSGLTASRTYAFRAFATNSAGTSYGTVRYFATRPVTPSVTVQNNVGGGNPTISASLTTSTPTYALTNVGNSNVTLYVTPAGGSATSFTINTSSTAPTVVQPTPLADGTYTVYAATTYNWSGADGTAGTITSVPQPTDYKTFTVDGTAPTVTSITSTAVTSGGTVNSTAAIPFTVTFSEKVTLTTTTTVTATNGTVSALVLNSNGTTLTFSVTPTAAGSITLTFPAGAVRDLVANPNAAASPFSFTYALPVPPTVVTNPAISITESMAILGGNVTSDGGAPVTARGVVFYPSGGTSQTAYMGTGTGSYGQNVTGLNSNRSYAFQAFATNSAGTSYGAVTSFTTIADAPFLSISPAGAGPPYNTLLNTRTPTYQGTTSANVTVYVGTTVANAVSVVSTTFNSSSTFSLVQPAGAPLADGTYVAYARATNGSGSSGNSNVVTFTIDATPPTPTISSTAGSSTSTTPIPFTVTFSESVTGFAASKVTVSNGTVTSGSFAGSGTTYTFTVTPTTAGTATTVSVAAGVAQDAGGQNNVAASAYALTYAAAVTNTTWTGTISPDWFTAGNWTAGVPTATINATISASTIFSPLIASGTATTQNLTLNSGATLNMSGGTLDVRANLTSNGTFVPTGGTVVLGTTASSNGPNILGSSRPRFWNLTVNSNGVLLSTSAGASVQRLLTLSGAFVTQSNPFVLESDASGTAMVVNVNSAGFVFGSATVQRYIDASGNTGTSGYRHYSAPVSGATVSSLSTSAYGGSFTAQVNAAYNTADPNQLTLATYPNVFGYDESKIAGSPAVSFSDFDKGYQSPASLSDPLTVGRGYTVQMGNAEKVQFTGPLNNNTQNITGLTYAATGTNGSASAGWALIGNPYPAPLDWRTVGTATGSGLNGVDGAAYVFQSTSAYSGRYTSFTNNVGAGTGLIASGQGFFVHVSTPGTTGSVTLTNANRVTSYASPAFQRTTAETRPLLRLSLALGNLPATVATAQDETFVYFETGATNGYDNKYDAYKLANPSGYYLGSATPGLAPLGLSIDGRAPLAATVTEIPLWVSLPAGPYTLTATELLNFATLAGGTQVQLRDAQLGTLTDLATVPSYSFSVAANASYAGRFSLVFRPGSALATLPGTALAQASASLYPNPATSATTLSVTDLPAAVASLQVEVADVLGRAVSHYTLPVRSGSATQRLATDQLANTLYLLRLTALDAQGQVQGTLPTQRLTLAH